MPGGNSKIFKAKFKMQSKKHDRRPGTGDRSSVFGLRSHIKRYFGTDQEGDIANLRFPGFSKDAAEFLIKERKINAVGTDTPSIDYGPSRDFIVHQIFGAANIPIFENVASLDRLPPKGTTVFAVPMKIKGGSGAPLRIFAVLP